MLSPKFYILLILLLFCQTKYGFAQNEDPVTSKDGYFGVDYIKGCAPLIVNITAQNGEGENRSYRWRSDKGGFVPFGPGKTLTLPDPGVYFITQNILSAAEDKGRFDSIRVEVPEPIPPEFKVMNCGAGEVVIKATPGFYDYFIVDGDENQKLEAPDFSIRLSYPVGRRQIKVKGMFSGHGIDNNCGEFVQEVNVLENLLPAASFNGLHANTETNSIVLEYKLLENVDYVLEVQENDTGNFKPISAEISETETLTLNATNFPGIELSQNFYCFRIRTLNPCNNSAPEPGFYYNKICSAKLSGSPKDNGNSIRYQTAPAPEIAVSLLRESTEISNFGNSPEEEYLDLAVNCNTAYHYAILISYPDGSVSFTEEISLTPEISGSLPAPENISSLWQNGKPLFKMLLPVSPPDAQYFGYFINSERTELAVSSPQNPIQLLNEEENSCFNFSYQDGCGNNSLLSENVCALYLINSTTQPDVLRPAWNEYTGYKEGVKEYELEEYDPQGNLLQTWSAGLETSLDLGEQPKEKSGYYYRVKAYPVKETLDVSTSNELVFKVVMKAYFPNAFSPDGDGVNEIFKAEGKFITGGQLEIFNRWGFPVFKSNEVTTGWDGWTKGKLAQPGTYIYKATVITEDGNQETLQGIVLLMR